MTGAALALSGRRRCVSASPEGSRAGVAGGRGRPGALQGLARQSFFPRSHGIQTTTCHSASSPYVPPPPSTTSPPPLILLESWPPGGLELVLQHSDCSARHRRRPETPRAPTFLPPRGRRSSAECELPLAIHAVNHGSPASPTLLAGQCQWQTLYFSWKSEIGRQQASICIFVSGAAWPSYGLWLRRVKLPERPGPCPEERYIPRAAS